MWFFWLALNSPGIMSSRHIHAVTCVAAPLSNISKHGDHQEDSLTITSSYRVVLFFIFKILCFETRASLPSPCWPGTLSPPSLVSQGLGHWHVLLLHLTPTHRLYGIKGYKAEWAEGENGRWAKVQRKAGFTQRTMCCEYCQWGNLTSDAMPRVFLGSGLTGPFA